MKASASTYTGSLGQSSGEYGVFNYLGYCYHTGDGGTSVFSSGTSSGMAAAEGNVVKLYLHNGALYYGKVGSGWYDAVSKTYKAAIADAAPFVTGLSGSWGPAASTGSGGATGTVTAHFASADWVDTAPSGADEWPAP